MNTVPPNKKFPFNFNKPGEVLFQYCADMFYVLFMDVNK